MKETDEENAAVLAAYEITAGTAQHMVRSDAFDTSTATLPREGSTLPRSAFEGVRLRIVSRHLLYNTLTREADYGIMRSVFGTWCPEALWDGSEKIGIIHSNNLQKRRKEKPSYDERSSTGKAGCGKSACPV